MMKPYINKAIDKAEREMMTTQTDRELMQQALDIIEGDWYSIDGERGPVKGGLDGAIERGDETLIPSLRAALAQPSELVAWRRYDSFHQSYDYSDTKLSDDSQSLYL